MVPGRGPQPHAADPWDRYVRVGAGDELFYIKIYFFTFFLMFFYLPPPPGSWPPMTHWPVSLYSPSLPRQKRLGKFFDLTGRRFRIFLSGQLGEDKNRGQHSGWSRLRCRVRPTVRVHVRRITCLEAIRRAQGGGQFTVGGQRP